MSKIPTFRIKDADGNPSNLEAVHIVYVRELERYNAKELREALNRTHRAYLCLQGINEKQATETADTMFPVSLPNV